MATKAAPAASTLTSPPIDDKGVEVQTSAESTPLEKPIPPAPATKPEQRKGIPIMTARFALQIEFGEWLEQIRPDRPKGYEMELVGSVLHVRWADRITQARELVLVPLNAIRSMRAFPEKGASKK